MRSKKGLGSPLKIPLIEGGFFVRRKGRALINLAVKSMKKLTKEQKEKVEINFFVLDQMTKNPAVFSDKQVKTAMANFKKKYQLS